MNEYNDIINLSHYEPRFHPRMSIYNRSAQFAPFAALTGYESAVYETARLTNKKLILTEDYKNLLDYKLQSLNNLTDLPNIKVIYFKQDNYKDGGCYLEYYGKIKKIDYINSNIIFNDNYKIEFSNIMEIDY